MLVTEEKISYNYQVTYLKKFLSVHLTLLFFLALLQGQSPVIEGVNKSFFKKNFIQSVPPQVHHGHHDLKDKRTSKASAFELLFGADLNFRSFSFKIIPQFSFIYHGPDSVFTGIGQQPRAPPLSFC